MLQSLLLVLSLCLDTFVASIAYGNDKIKIPVISAVLINLVCSLLLAFSLLTGYFFKDFIPYHLASLLSFLILFTLGVYRLFEVFLKKYFNKFLAKNKPLTFKVFDFKFVLEVYANEIKADYDNSKILTGKEAFYLGFALSLDSIAVGFGSSLGNVNYIQVLILSFFIGMISLLFGVYLGKHFRDKIDIELSWLSGVILIVLATMKIM